MKEFYAIVDYESLSCPNVLGVTSDEKLIKKIRALNDQHYPPLWIQKVEVDRISPEFNNHIKFMESAK
jgi:hypothetical protein